MKTTSLKKAAILAGSLSFLAGSAFSQTAVSGAGGYTTYDIQPGFNLIGLTLHNPVERTGTVTSVDGQTVTGDADLTEFIAGLTYIVEFTSGDLDGTVQEVTVWQGTDFQVPAEIAADVEAGGTYQFRRAATLGEVFGGDLDGDGEINGNEKEVVINKGTGTTGDLILVPNGMGGFNQYYHTEDDPIFGPGSWNGIAPAVGSVTTPLIFCDGFYVQNRAQPAEAYDVVLTGMVKTEKVALAVTETFNYYSGIYPVGTTLDTSGLEDFILNGTGTSGDLVLLPNPAGGFDQYYRTPDDPIFGDGAWTPVPPATGDLNTPITSGFIIQRRNTNAYNADYTPPSFYENL